MRKIFTLLVLLCTTVMALQAQFTEDFESGFDGWTAENIWRHGNSTANSSQYFPIPAHSNFMAANDDAAGNGVDGTGRLISPMIDLTGLAAPFVRFDAYFPNLDFGGANETAKVFVSDNGGASWKEIADLDGNGTEWYTAIADVTEYGNKTIQIAFEYNDGNAWNYGLAIDNVEFYQGPANDVRLASFEIERFLPAGDMPVRIEVSNQGYETVTSLEFTWEEGGVMNTETVTGLNIGPLESATVTHPVSFAGGTQAKQYDLSVSIAMPNGAMDANMSDNSAGGTASFIIDVPKKVVVAEEKTGTWCTWCPRGDVFLRQMVANYPDNFIGIAVHNNDPMEDAEYDGALGAAFPGGYPNVIMSRSEIMDPSAMPNAIDGYLARTSPVSVDGSAHYNNATNNVEVSVTLTSHTEIDGIRFNLSAVLIENEMSGTTSGWAQVNAYSGGGNGPMGGYENLPNPVPASMMVYDHVGRKLIGGFTGDATAVPASLVDGSTATAKLTASVPTDADLEKMNVVLLVTDRATGEIYNAGETHLTGVYPKFASSSLVGCGPFEVEFTDVSDSTASYLWTFEGGTPATSSDKNPTVVFDGEGAHDVKLTAFTNNGNTYTIDRQNLIFLDTKPASDFDYAGTDDGVVDFSDMSTDANSHVWDFGDGETSTSRNPTHEYAASGTYTVTLTTANGTCSNEYSEQIEVKVYPLFTSSAEVGCGPFEVQFTDVSDSTASYAWTFEGGTPATSTEANPTVVFDGEGAHDVKLTAFTNNGNTYTIDRQNLIFLDTKPASDFDYAGTDDGVVDFSDMSTDANSHVWDFGDGETSTSRNPTHEYAASGTYTVTLTTANGTCSNEYSEQIEVKVYPLFTSSEEVGCGPFEVQFTDVSDSTASYAWTFEGGTPATSTEANPTVTFNGEGFYDVFLTAVTNSGVTYSITREDVVFLDKQTTADFSFDINGGEVAFNDMSIEAIDYLWDYGNGVNSTKSDPTYTYPSSGFYTVTLRTENGTCSDETSKDIEVILVGLNDVIESSWSLSAAPNPFSEEVIINYDLADNDGRSQLVVYNYMGQELFTQNLNNQSGYVRLGEELSQGIFFVQVRQDQKVSQILKVTKLK